MIISEKLCCFHFFRGKPDRNKTRSKREIQKFLRIFQNLTRTDLFEDILNIFIGSLNSYFGRKNVFVMLPLEIKFVLMSQKSKLDIDMEFFLVLTRFLKRIKIIYKLSKEIILVAAKIAIWTISTKVMPSTRLKIIIYSFPACLREGKMNKTLQLLICGDEKVKRHRRGTVVP